MESGSKLSRLRRQVGPFPQRRVESVLLLRLHRAQLLQILSHPCSFLGTELKNNGAMFLQILDSGSNCGLHGPSLGKLAIYRPTSYSLVARPCGTHLSLAALPTLPAQRSLQLVVFCAVSAVICTPQSFAIHSKHIFPCSTFGGGGGHSDPGQVVDVQFGDDLLPIAAAVPVFADSGRSNACLEEECPGGKDLLLLAIMY